MATYNELFPDDQQEPFAPIQPGRVSPRLSEIREAGMRTALPGGALGGGFEDAFGDLLTAIPQQGQPQGETEWKDYGKAAVAGVGDLGQAGAGAVEWGANKLAGAQETPLEQTFGDLAGAARSGRQASAEFADNWFAKMSPEAQARATREVLSLDPNNTMWQGGPSEFLSSVGLKMARSAPSTAVTLLPGALIMRAGLGKGALVYLGASEGGLSLGSIAANIAQEVEQAPEEELMQSPRYAELRSTMGQEEARRQLITEAQGNAPLYGGLIVGAISAAAGRYLEPVFTDKAVGALSRFGRGAASEGMQEAGQSSAEQVAQNAAAQLYDTDRGLGEGVAEAGAQGAVIGGAMGGGMTMAVGPRAEAPITGSPTSTDAAPDQPIPAGPTTASFQDVFGDIAPREPTQFDAAGQGMIDTNPVSADLQAAANARRDGKIDDMFANQGMSPQQEQGSYMQKPWPVHQEGMALPQATTDVVPAPEPGQMNLGLRERQRGGPPIPVEPTAAQPLVEDMSPPAGFAGVSVTEPGIPGRSRADFLRQRASLMQAPPTFKDENQQDMFAAPPMGDTPSAEPLGDLLAQMEDLRDPDSTRLGVYLSQANINQLRSDGTFERMRGAGVPLANFDGKGGTLIAKSRRVAEELIAARDSGVDMQEILGLATGAGTGKPAGGDIAVQQRDEEGNVLRESLVSSPQEADQLASTFETAGRESAILSAGMAIKRRAQRIREESRQAGAEKDIKGTRRLATDVIDAELGDTKLALSAKRRITKKTLSENEAARKLVKYGTRLRKKEVAKRLGDVDAPESLEFADPKAAEQYKDLFGQYRDAEIAERMATTAENNLRARALREGLRRQIGAHRRISKASSPSEKVVRAARKISQEEVQKIEREARETATTRVDTEGDILGGATRTTLEKATSEQIERMNDSEVGLLFVEAANIASGSRVKRGTVSGPQGETTAFTPHGKTMDEIIAAHPTRSEKLKLIGRVKRLMEVRKYGGKSKTKPITATAKTRKTATGEKVSMRKGVLTPQRAFDLAPPREMSKADQAKHDARVRQAFHELTQATAGLAKKQFSDFGSAFSAIARRREGDGNQPQSARDAIYGRVYLRVLMRYGQLLAQLHPRSTAGLKEVERFTKIAEDLNKLSGEKLFKKLAALTDAEISEQGNIVARVDPTVLGFVSSRKKRRATANASVRKLEERIKWAKRMHDVWHTNAKFEQFVAPLMQKMIGYLTHDTSLANVEVERRGLGYEPTFNEVRNLRFALREFKQTNKEDLYKPIKRWFSEIGFKFDADGDLVLAKNAAQYDSSDFKQAAEERTRAAFRNAPLNYTQKMKAAARKKLDEFLSGERKRRAGLTTKQRNLEDIRLANKIEKDRRSGMSFEQRKALEALDRQQPLYLDLMDISTDMPGVRGAAQAMADLLEENQDGAVDLTDLLKLASAKLAPDNAYQAILQRLIKLDMKDATVGWDRTGRIVSKGFAHYQQVNNPTGTRRSIMINRPKFEQLRSTGRDPSLGFLHAIVHEATHAATVGAIRNNFAYQRAITTLIRHIKATAEASGMTIVDPALGKNNEMYYGLTGIPEEFIAEAFSNHRFQQFLKGIVFDQTRSVWRYMIDLIKRFLGLPETPQVSNALELVMATTDRLFTGELTNLSAGAQDALHIDDPFVQSHAGNVIDKLMQSSRVTKDVRQKATNMLEMNKEGGSRFLLSALTMEQIRDFYNKSFGASGGPLNDYMKAFFQRNADNSANMEKADKLSRRWTALTEEHGADEAVELSRVMTEGTLYGIHPNEPLTSNANATVTSAQQKSRHADLAKRYKAMNADWKSLYNDAQQFYDETFRREVALVALNAIRASVGEGSFNYGERDVERLKLNTIKGLEKEFGDKLTTSERTLIARIASLPQSRIGPYFPLMRFGDYVVTAERVRESKTFQDAAKARLWAQEQRESDPTLSVSSPIESETGYVVNVVEKEVRMAETPSEAEENRKAMLEEYGSGNVSQVQLKAQLYTRGATIESGSGLKTILNKLDGNPAAQAAIKDFYLRSLSDGAFRKREIKRANRRGVDYDTQHRTFASYAKSAAYYTSQLRFGWQMADALIGMQKYVEETAKGEHQADISPIRMGEVVREINTRDKLTTDHVEVSKLVRGGTELSQFMMLTSPSYWMINATQPYMVTLPWLAARSSTGEATAALLNAQKLIASPIVNQMVESAGGLKALWSKAGAEKAFTVLEQVEEHIKARGGARADEYIAMLNKLKRESIIDLSFVAELRDIAEGQNTSLTQKVLDASRIMSHLSEVNNRILTAVAAYDLYRNKGSTVAEAEGFAKQAVSLTQFNYSSGNAPRLFQARGPLGQMGPLVFQFMKYPQHMYALLIDNMRRAVYSGGMDRKVAIKTLAGLFSTHLAAGGIIGMTLQPIKWAIGLALAAFGDDDEPYSVKNALSGDTFDRLIRESTAELFGNDAGEIMSAGLPRAAGVDLSSRMSLGSLYFIDLKTDSAESTLGSLMQSFGGPLVNLGAGFYRGAQYMAEGQVAKGLEAFLPKGAKDIAKTLRYTNDGLTDATGKEILGAKDMTPWELFAQSMGFSPAKIADKYEGRAAIKDEQRHDDTRRAVLLRRFQNADPDERAGIIREIAAFNRANPAATISRSQLLKSTVEFRRREARVKRYGVDLRGADVAYAEAGSPYEDD